MKTLRSFFILCLLLASLPAQASTLLLEGRLDTEVTVREQITFGVQKPISELTYRFPLPASVAVAGFSQQSLDNRFRFTPEPSSVTDETDRYGNRFKVLTWKGLKTDVLGEVAFTTAIAANLQTITLQAPFPLAAVPEDAGYYLKPAKLVQSDDAEIIARAKELTAGVATQHGAVEAILNYVTDHITYETPPKSYDALFALRSGTGNCQNFAHLAMALLRASGIPARVAIGLTLKDKWRIPTDERGSAIVQGMGEGLHAWLEVWYPELGWLPYDPQQSKQFTSTRHIKYSHGPECGDIGISWRGAPGLPTYSSTISSTFSRDIVDLRLRGSGSAPRGYMASNRIVSGAPEPVPPQPKPPKPLKPPVVKPKPQPDDNGVVVFGNPRLPERLILQNISADKGELALERETAEYVTSSSVYAQAFTLDRPMRLQSVSLGMKKFGGDGAVYLDIVADDNGKPGLTNGVRTMPISLDTIRRIPGYGWLDFPVPPDAGPFKPGKYWIVLRRSGEAIMNWYYTPGKPYGGPDDTRSTSKGWQWEDILTYDFVFKVAGRVAK